jgi:isopentenyl-diphosphate delta-isomerase
MAEITRRKNEHIEIVLARDVGAHACRTGFDGFRFEHNALPEISLDSIDIRTDFLGRRLHAPLLISSMTGGPERAAAINRAIAEAAEELRIAFAVGSQRIALEQRGTAGFGRELRRLAPDVPILANFGAAQLKVWQGADMARRAVDMIEADALIVHLNPLQEAVQPGGDKDWTGVLAALAKLRREIEVPIVVKEVGAGISGAVARRLADAGIDIIDVAGAGGTSWAAVEAERAVEPAQKAVAEAFRDWGIPTAEAIVAVREACPAATLIASGGVRTGIDVAKAIRLGADIAGQAAGVLPAALEGPAAIAAHMSVVVDQLRTACFCTGSSTLAALRKAPIALIGGQTGRL